MYQSTLRFEFYKPDSEELLKLMQEYTPIVWEMREEFREHSIEDFTALLINDIPNWDSAIVAYCGTCPMGIIAVSGIMHSVYHKGNGVSLLHVFAAQPGVGWSMYRYLRKLAKDADIQWICTTHPNSDKSEVLIKFNKV